MKISHESPLSMLEMSRGYNDYCYALVHLFETEPTYYKFFEDSLKMGRHVLLDNSIFELGTAFESSKYVDWIEKLQPTEYIIPDVLENSLGTIDSASRFLDKYGERLARNAPNSKTIGVMQGKNYSDLVMCYNFLDKLINVDKIAISFDLPFYYLSVCPHPNKWMGCTLGRVQTIIKMLNEGIINTNKRHHLLGCSLPAEFMFYRNGFEWIETIDTSSPVVHGLLNIRYEPGGLVNKQTIKLVDLLGAQPDEDTKNIIMFNIQCFRSYVNGV